jgi:hypothetical protein
MNRCLTCLIGLSVVFGVQHISDVGTTPVQASQWVTVPYQHNSKQSRDAYERGMEYARQKKFSQAEKWLNKAIAYDDQNRAAFANLGVVYSELGDHKQAIAMFEHAMTIPLGFVKTQTSDKRLVIDDPAQLAVESASEDVLAAQSPAQTKTPPVKAVKKQTDQTTIPSSDLQSMAQLARLNTDQEFSSLNERRDQMIRSYIEQTAPNYATTDQTGLIDMNLETIPVAEPDTDVETVARIVEVDNQLLELCRADKLGFEMLCDRDWHMDFSGPAVIITMDDQPNALMVVERINRPIYFIEDFTDDYIAQNRIYKDGFRSQRIQTAHLDAIEVQGRSYKNPFAQHLDYYFVNDGQLYGLFFIVSPAKEFSEYQNMIRYIAGSFRMI